MINKNRILSYQEWYEEAKRLGVTKTQQALDKASDNYLKNEEWSKEIEVMYNAFFDFISDETTGK